MTFQMTPTGLYLQCKCGWRGLEHELKTAEMTGNRVCPDCCEVFVPWSKNTEVKPIAQLIASRPDADIAKDLKTELEAKLGEVCTVIDKANAAGFEVAFNLGKRWDGKQVIGQLTIAKHF